MAKEFELDKIMISDIVNICKEDIIANDSKNRNKFGTKSLDKKLTKLGKEIFDVNYMGKDKGLEKVIEKMEKIMPEILKLHPNIDISIVSRVGHQIGVIENTAGKGSLVDLKTLFAYAKENEKEMREFRKNEKAEKARREKEEAQREKDANDPDKIYEREEAKRNREAANNIWKIDKINKITANERATIDDARREYKETGRDTWGKIDKATKEANRKLEEAGLDDR